MFIYIKKTFKNATKQHNTKKKMLNFSKFNNKWLLICFSFILSFIYVYYFEIYLAGPLHCEGPDFESTLKELDLAIKNRNYELALAQFKYKYDNTMGIDFKARLLALAIDNYKVALNNKATFIHNMDLYKQAQGK